MNNAKVLRGQLRQIAKELLPEVISTELFKALQTELSARLTKVEDNVKETLEMIDSRQKDTLGYLVRQVTTNAAPMPHTIEPKSE